MAQIDPDSERFRMTNIALFVIGVVAAAALGYLLRGPGIALAMGAGAVVSELFVLLYRRVRHSS